MSFKHGNRGKMDGLSGRARLERNAPGSLRFANRGVYFFHFVGRLATNYRSRHVAVVARHVIHREDVDNHREIFLQRSRSVMVTVGDVGSGRHDRTVRVGEILLDQKSGDHRPNTLGGEDRAVVVENAILIRPGVRDGSAGEGHRFARDLLGMA